jgi:hypothetical protein
MKTGANQISCPGCGELISVAEVLAADIEDRLKREYKRQMGKLEKDLEEKELAVEKEKERIAADRKKLQETVKDQVEKEKKGLRQKLLDEVRDETALEIEDLKSQVSEKDGKLAKALTAELELRKRARALEEKEAEMEVEFQRKLDLQRESLRAEVADKLTEEHRLKTAEKDAQLDSMRRQIEDLKRKAEQGSQQTQGEVLEMEIEAVLKAMFPVDQVEPVAKGVKGGDVLQQVITQTGQVAGAILWETKRTRNWSDGWITKLKEDQRAACAELAVIVTQALPKGVAHLALIDGVWVCDVATAPGLATALRAHLLQVQVAKSAAAGKGEKMELVYQYLTGTQFKQRVEAMVETFRAMQEHLLKERRVIEKSWALREKQLSTMVSNMVGMYGDIQGFVGASLPKIEAMELEQLGVSAEAEPAGLVQ